MSQQPRELSQLYPSGTSLSEVHPDFRGMKPELWLSLKIQEQGSQLSRKFLAQFVNGVPDATARSLGKSEWRAKDSYGI